MLLSRGGRSIAGLAASQPVPSHRLTAAGLVPIPAQQSHYYLPLQQQHRHLWRPTDLPQRCLSSSALPLGSSTGARVQPPNFRPAHRCLSSAPRNNSDESDSAAEAVSEGSASESEDGLSEEPQVAELSTEVSEDVPAAEAAPPVGIPIGNPRALAEQAIVQQHMEDPQSIPSRLWNPFLKLPREPKADLAPEVLCREVSMLQQDRQAARLKWYPKQPEFLVALRIFMTDSKIQVPFAMAWQVTQRSTGDLMEGMGKVVYIKSSVRQKVSRHLAWRSGCSLDLVEKNGVTIEEGLDELQTFLDRYFGSQRKSYSLVTNHEEVNMLIDELRRRRGFLPRCFASYFDLGEQFALYWGRTRFTALALEHAPVPIMLKTLRKRLEMPTRSPLDMALSMSKVISTICSLKEARWLFPQRPDRQRPYQVPDAQHVTCAVVTGRMHALQPHRLRHTFKLMTGEPIIDLFEVNDGPSRSPTCVLIKAAGHREIMVSRHRTSFSDLGFRIRPITLRSYNDLVDRHKKSEALMTLLQNGVPIPEQALALARPHHNWRFSYVHVRFAPLYWTKQDIIQTFASLQLAEDQISRVRWRRSCSFMLELPSPDHAVLAMLYNNILVSPGEGNLMPLNVGLADEWNFQLAVAQSLQQEDPMMVGSQADYTSGDQAAQEVGEEALANAEQGPDALEWPEEPDFGALRGNLEPWDEEAASQSAKKGPKNSSNDNTGIPGDELFSLQ